MERATSNGHDLEDPREQALSVLLRGGVCPNDAISCAHRIYQSIHRREILEALFLAGCNAEEIESATKIDRAIVAAYEYLFFDPTVFEDDLDRIAYAEEYAGSAFGKEMKQYAMHVGKDGLLVRVSRGSHVVSPSDAHRSIRNTAYLLAQAAKMNPLNSALTREAFRWAQLAMRASENAPDANAGNPVLDLEINIRTVDETRSKENSELSPEDISRGD